MRLNSLQDLATGHRIVYRNRERGIVLKDLGIICIEQGGFNRLEALDKVPREWEIVEVYNPPVHAKMLSHSERGEMIWNDADREAITSMFLLDQQIVEVKAQLQAIIESRAAIEKTLTVPVGG